MLLTVVGLLGLAVILASIVEAFLEWLVAPIFELGKLRALDVKVRTVIFRWLAVLISFGIVVWFQLDIIYLFGLFMEIQHAQLQSVSWVGLSLTSVLVGMGSSRLHQWILKYFVKTPTIAELPTP